jgi:hypothetical protein
MLYNDDGLALVSLCRVLVGGGRNDLGQADGCRGLVYALSCTFGRLTGAVGLGHHKASQNRLVEGGIGTAYRMLANNTRSDECSTYEPETCTDAPTA